MVSLRRTIALLVTILALLTAGGVHTVAAATEPACPSSCCPSEQAPASNDSCPEPECQCTFCLTMDILPPPALKSATSADLSWAAAVASLPFSDFIRIIEHPPRG